MKKFSEEYKKEAVEMVEVTGLQATQVAKDLGIGRSTLEKWIREYRDMKTPQSVSLNEREELKRLREENHKLKLERDLLKKAAVFFANDRSS
jgi:transposase